MDSGFNIPAPPISRYQFRDDAVSLTSARLDVRVQTPTREQSRREVLGSPIYGTGELVLFYTAKKSSRNELNRRSYRKPTQVDWHYMPRRSK